MDITQHGKHTFMYLNECLPCLTTDDYELFDVMDDYLTEDCDYDFECLYYHESFKKVILQWKLKVAFHLLNLLLLFRNSIWMK